MTRQPVHYEAAESPASAGDSVRDPRPAQIQDEWQKLLEFGRQHVDVRLRQLRAAVQEALWSLLFRAVLAVMGAVALAAGVWMVVWGAASGLAATGMLPLWASQVLIGMATLILLTALLAARRMRWQNAFLVSSMGRFRDRQRQQQTRYGTDVEHAGR